jgi:hypothetical protein
MAYHLYRQLPEEGTRVSLGEAATRSGMDEKVARQILHLLWQYELVNVW